MLAARFWFGSMGLAAVCWMGTAQGLGQSAPLSSAGHREETSTTASVTETQWNLIELNGSAVALPPAQKQPYIYLQEEGDRLSGSDSCNRLLGSYDLSGNSLQFHSVAQTKMACRGDFTDREEEFVEALKLATSFQISGDVLLLKADDGVVARFQARKK